MLGRHTAVFFLILFAPLSSFATDKKSPEFLRERHAGTVAFSSSESVDDLYPKLFQAVSECWEFNGPMQAPAGTGGAIGGAAAAISQASRFAVGELAEDRSTAWVAVRAKGAMGLLQSNFLQIDLESLGDTTRVTAYHQRNVKGQREFLEEVGVWVSGDLTFCKPKLGVRRRRQSSSGSDHD